MRTSFIIDFKINKQGAVRIMEMGRALPSGYDGYKDITGKDMLWDNVAKDLKQEGVLLWSTQPDVLRPDHSLAKKRSLFGCSADLGKSKLRTDFVVQAGSMKNVIIWQGPHQLEQAKTVEQTYGQDIDLQIVDSSLVSALCFDSKACLHAFAGDVLEPILPDEEIYIIPKDSADFRFTAKRMAFQIKQDIGVKSGYVLKPSESAQGKGIVISGHDDLEENLYQFFQEFYSDPMMGMNSMFDRGIKQSDRGCNFFVAQELVTSSPVSMRKAFQSLAPSNLSTLFHRLSASKKDDYDREPTIRMVLSYVDGHLINHGSYYKLSSAPVGDALSSKSVLSNAKFSAPVPKAIEERAFSDMKPHLMKMFQKFEDVPLEDMLDQMKHSGNKVLNSLALDTLNDKRLPHIAPKVLAMADDSNNPRQYSA